ncbi:MAG: 16S rRNA (cytosine(967)-C(5))-methyltransferase RsmB, partial [Candidatus Firestonebacteria bacterium]|nr:16S rRNA (cytosine(967)-C(5))-methyltransferase RsmB [Candidatus Firestonebacteria bacterium]
MNERSIVLDIINKVEANNGYVNILLSNYLKNTQLDIKERNLITELAYGVIRHKN